MANQHNNFKKDIDLLSEAYNSINKSTEEEVLSESAEDPNPVENGEAAYKGGNVEHD